MKSGIWPFLLVIVGAVVWACGYATGYDNGVDAVINRFAGVEIVAQTEIPLHIREEK